MRLRSARYSIGSGPNTEAYTSAIASISALIRSSLVPTFGRNRLLYLPENAAPIRSSSRLELRTISGLPSRSSSASESPFMISGAKREFLKTWMMCGYSRRIWSISRYLRL